MHSRFGIGFRLLVVFFAAFMLMSALGLALLRRDLVSSFEGMEQREAAQNAARLVNSFDAALAALHAHSKGWSNWDDLYQYALSPNYAFEKSNLGNDSLQNEDFALVQIFDRYGQLIANHIANIPEQHDFDLGMVGHSKTTSLTIEPGKSEGCGLMASSLGLLMTCRLPILLSSAEGPPMGTLVIARHMDRALLQQVRGQTELPFELRYPAPPLPQLGRMALLSKPLYMTGRWLWLRTQQNQIVFDYPLLDWAGRPVATIHLALPRRLMAQGERLLWRSTVQLGLSAAVIGLLLLALVQLLFVRPLARLQRSVHEIRSGRAWGQRVRARGRDEISQLGTEINGLLGVIDHQVDELEQLSMTDSLTGLPNRRAFDVQLLKELSRVKRSGQPLSLLLLDIDYFKQYNDHYGHPGGDLALQALGEVVMAVARRGIDLGARLGGEEFALLLCGTDSTGAQAVAHTLQTRLAERAIPHARSEVSDKLTLCIGVASTSDGDESPTSFIHRADEALYRAKRAGRNRVMVA